jgi:uncharacterized protein (TIGR03084 family)
MEAICRDLNAEHEALEAVLEKLDEPQWQTMTPSPGWNIKDQVRHLAYFDERAALSATNTSKFNRHLEEAFGDLERWVRVLDEVGRDLSTEALMSWWRQERKKMLDAYAALGPKTQLPWYGLPMSALSSATARLMETWAHGQDVFDALRLKRTNSDRLRHIAFLGVNTFGWTYTNRGLEKPATAVRVELTAPSGAVWTWGPADATNRISGPAEGFCLVVVQRRHMDDTGLEVIGDVARDWMLKAQCFAGPPTDGPKPGERVFAP